MIVDAVQRARDRERGEQYNERWCQDCKEDMNNYPGHPRRIRCKNCGLLLCTWCWSHDHFRGQARY